MRSEVVDLPRAVVMLLNPHNVVDAAEEGNEHELCFAVAVFPV